MDNSEFVEVFEAREDLLVELASLDFVEPCVSHNVVEELASTRVLHNQVELLGGLDDFVHLYDVRVTQQLQDVDFPSHSLNVGSVTDPIFLQDLDSHFFVSYDVGPELNFPECAFANALPEQVVAYLPVARLV
eukprot:CAMPEP_0204907666 /NCGR_PEP_ID=MMETSP1397-20131031/6761_1 /ASSEMBLY_ACC=CAM_ASM_000891 /TAXON_ID=49980 /ORGANISM="Climacostomum Climacostomum virens, Strain Stock W-24" /LENGTH=132 /DNA_ID=CAMNT_0052076901 /DNA_START=1125 /DNA_END=1520 /DNA_ORIENTATION=+